MHDKSSNFQPTNLPKVTYGPTIFPDSNKYGYSTQSSASANGSSRFSNSRYGGVKTYHVDQSSAGKSEILEKITSGPYGKMVIIEPAYKIMSANHIVSTSAGACHLLLESKYEAGSKAP